MKLVSKCLGVGAAFALISIPAFGAGADQTDQKPLQDQVQQDQSAQQVTQDQVQQDQSAQQVTQDQAQQDQVQQSADQSQQMTQDQAQQVQQSQGLIVRVTQDESGAVQQEEVRVVTRDVDPALLASGDIEALFESSLDITGVPVSDADEEGMVPENRRPGWGYRPYRRPSIFGPLAPIIYRNPYYYPYPRYGYWYYPRWR